MSAVSGNKRYLPVNMQIYHAGSMFLSSGAILVFLPGYDDIVTLRDKLLNDERKFSDGNRYRIYTLHSAMQSSDQKKVFQSTPKGTRKIVSMFDHLGISHNTF